ncbi:multidrug resistance protein [Actibacterium atlanticum]|uniref:Bcr/CflA family efflux transporter n=1 Tax=Actibacterium atlanticum TaxID=1461693 RepID=A0A058ZJ99_9RHOB|nr:multidrug effflux MFS transporter [Actibacterium atlanticum]KCV81653.1 multidrug resistance protein [Actibacterium atlanticum]
MPLAPPPFGKAPHILTLVLMAGLSALSLNIFLPSLPGMTAYFETDYRVMQLSVAAYLAVNAVLQIFIGPISDKYGRRPVVLGSVSLFCLATLGCLIAPNASVFLLCRMTQAVVAACMVLSRAVVRDTHDTEQSASMIGYVTMGMAVVPMVGPAIGGLLDEAFGWRASFGFLLASGLGVWALVWKDLGETKAPSDLSLAAQFREYPELLSSRRFWGYAGVAGLISGAFFAFLGGAPYVGENVFQLSPAQLGLYFSTSAMGYIMGNFLSGRYSARIGINPMIVMGTLITTAGLAASLLLFLIGATHPIAFFGFMVPLGLGNGLVMPNATAGALSVRPHLAGTASGLGGAIIIGGGAGLSALAGALLSPGTGIYPLLLIMLATSAASILCMLYVLKVDRVMRDR